MRKRTKIAWLVCGALFFESIVMLNVRWCRSSSFRIVNETDQLVTEVAFHYKGKKYWQGLLGPWEIEQATVPTGNTKVVETQVTFATGAKLSHPGTYVAPTLGGYDLVKVGYQEIKLEFSRGSGYLGLAGDGSFATLIKFADLGVRYMTCPVRWINTSISY